MTIEHTHLDEPWFVFVGRDTMVVGTIVSAGEVAAAPTGVVRLTGLDSHGDPNSRELQEGASDFALFLHPMATGVRSYGVEYAGDQNFRPASAVFSYEVFTGPETATTLTTTAQGDLAPGDRVTVTAQVTTPNGGTLTGLADGHLEFFDNGDSLAGGDPLDERGWRASLTTSTLGSGTHKITAAYQPFVWYPYSLSAELVLNVTAAPTPASSVRGRISVQPGGTVPHGTRIAAVATISARTPGLEAPTGSVQFYDWDTSVGDVVELTGGTAAFSYPDLRTGKHVLQARYLGDGNFAPDFTSASTVVVQSASHRQRLPDWHP